MSLTGKLIIAAVTVGLCVFSAWQLSQNVLKSIQQAFADEQTEIFAEMVMQSSDALQRSPPNIAAARGSLEYTHYYYPSGTKQAKGSVLDRIVERSRDSAEQQILDMLCRETGDAPSTFAEWVTQADPGVTDEAKADE